MSAVAAAVVGSAVIGGVVASSSASKAARAQTQAADAAAAEQRAAREELRTLLAPYSSAGIPALQAQMNLLGIGGTAATSGTPGQQDWAGYLSANPDVAQEAQRLVQQGQFASPEQYAQYHYQTFGQREGRQVPMTGGTAGQAGVSAQQAQQQAINQFEQSPMFQALARQGETAILQNASATGGLRGGNVQGALGQFRPALLNQQIQQQFQNLGGLTALGQSSAAGIGVGGQNAANQIGNALTIAGQAQAGGALGQGAAFNNALGQIGGFAASGGFGGSPITSGTVARLTPSATSTIAANRAIF